MESIFRFKEFEINQQGCAMKINTDGVLLGATISSENPLRILDIGTGTGVIAMMLAQRFPMTNLDAVEIDEEAFKTSLENFRNSPFKSRIQSFLGSFEEIKPTEKYNLIVSNPPFYTNSLHNPDSRKKLARHTDFDFFERLLNFAKQHLTDSGDLALILPPELAIEVINHGQHLGLSLSRDFRIKSFADSEIIRNIITLSKNPSSEVMTEEFVIYEEKGVYSEAYRTVLKPFFLAF